MLFASAGISRDSGNPPKAHHVRTPIGGTLLNPLILYSTVKIIEAILHIEDKITPLAITLFLLML
ncbi:hypothetical protein J2S44_007314 [Catenuloplanes niger]|uniref:Uncharacterized protein n=1 Tax=Catenuloplanes niger TaxID=587534 RepID=A0AAE3ZVY2_9ACTN|nr:hypothetical protein [Catenuloplanes niger]